MPELHVFEHTPVVRQSVDVQSLFLPHLAPNAPAIALQAPA
jgi:hypothetical protein